METWNPGTILKKSEGQKAGQREEGREGSGRKSSPRASSDQGVLGPEWPPCVGIIFLFCFFFV